MSIRKIHTEKAPAAVGPFSQGCIAGEGLYLSGQGRVPSGRWQSCFRRRKLSAVRRVSVWLPRSCRWTSSVRLK